MGSLYIFLVSVLGTTIVWFYKRMTVEEQDYIFIKYYEKVVYKFVYTLVFAIFVFIFILLINSVFQPDNFFYSILYNDQGKFMFINFSYLLMGLIVASATILVHMIPALHYKSSSEESLGTHMKSLLDRLDVIMEKQKNLFAKLNLEYTEVKTTEDNANKEGKFWKIVKKYKIKSLIWVLFIFTALLFFFNHDVVNYVFIGVYFIIVFQRLEPIVTDLIDLPSVKILETLQFNDINELFKRNQIEAISYYSSEIIIYSTEEFGSYILFNTNTRVAIRYSVNTSATKRYRKNLLLVEELEKKLSEREEDAQSYLDTTKELENTKKTVKKYKDEIKKLKKKNELLQSD